MKKALLFLIIMVLCNIVFAQSITVTSPNGGEVLPGCTTHVITWNSLGTSDYYSIDYSTDNGSTWTSITSFYNTTTGTYNWTVPNTSSGTCLIRIIDSNDSMISDQSDMVFTVTSPLTVLVPNGGESWEAGTQETISFNANGTSNYYDISYSTDAGSNWTNVATNWYNISHNYNWNVPNTPSSNCLVKIRDHSNSCMTDISDNLFTITPATSSITVSSPNGGEVWYVGQNKTITWTANNTTDYYNIDYSTDNGSTWTSLTSSYYTVSGTYSWTIPNTPSTNCLVKVTDANNTPVTDVSNSVFTIAEPFITVVSPNGGESLGSCDSEYINFQCGGTSSYYKIEYSVDNGSNWTTITSSFYSTSSNPSYLWSTIPNNDSGNCLIRITDKNDASILDQSDAVFTIVPNEDIIVTSPNGGESWEVGSTNQITWVSAPSSDRYSVYYSVNNGSSWTLITSGTYNNYYAWTVPDNESAQALIKVVDYDNTCINDQSDANFTIAPPTPIITVTSPNTNVTYYQNNSYTISWTSAYLNSTFVTIQYSIDNGSTWQEVVAVTEDDGSYTWTVPEVVSVNCLVMINEYENAAVYDVSDVNFTIAEQFITVTYPNGGEVWTGCDERTITYTKGGISSFVMIEYSDDNGLTWNTIASNTASSGSYSWSPVTDFGSTNCLVRVSDKNDNSINDESDAIFTIEKNTDIYITDPNGGESLEVDAVYNLSWAASAGHTHFKLYYSIDNGTSWDLISGSVYSTSYAWTVPNTPSDQCLFKVVDYDNTCIYDISDAIFSINPPTPVIEVTYPNTGQTLYVGTSYNITWTHEYDDVDFVKIEYSVDNGTTWQTVVAVTENDGSYEWLVPDEPSEDCLVRIFDIDDISFIDECDMNFIIASPFITINYPNGGETLYGCDSYNINWTCGGTSNYYKIEYSSDNGSTWNSINTNYYSVSTTINYLWDPVVNEGSSMFLIRVSDKNDATVSDLSDSNFTINPNTDIIVTSPNGGETWEIGDTYQITWVAAGSSNRFSVYYSVNNGATWTSLTTGTYSDFFNWTIPDNESDQCLIKVIDYDNTCIKDQSDAVFSIVQPAPEIIVTYPNTATTLYNYGTANITWTSEFTVSEFVTIEYSIDNGDTWSTIVTPTEDDGTYSWTIPEVSSDQCLVRVSEYGNPTVNDVSDVCFTIAPPYITVTSPDGGEVLDGCDTHTISWSRGGVSNHYKIEYSEDNGATWNTITNDSYITGSTYSWDPVTDIQTSQALIRVSDVNYTVATDVSDAVFGINKNDDIVVVTPNGGENLEVGTTWEIDWISDPSVTHYKVYYSINGGTSWILVGSTYSSYYNWTIPDNVSDQCLIKVSDYDNSCVHDISDAVYSITPPTPVITVSYPNTAVTLYVNQSYNITWSSEYLSSSFVKIEYSVDNGVTWNIIANATEDDGSYSWLIPDAVSDNCLVQISEYENPVVYDVSDTNFSIAYPFVELTAPNGGEELEGCESFNITWTRGGVSNYYKIEYSTNGGADWHTIVSNSYITGTSYTWNSISDLASTNCIIRITDNNYTAATDVSDAAFTINKNEDIIVTTPDGGEFWQVGTVQTIEWVSASTSDHFYVYYSVNGGTTFTNITSTYNNSYNWTIPNNPSSQCLIKVVDYDNSCIKDQSDEYFAITPADVTLNTPNGGQTLYYGSDYTITWTDEYISSNFVKLEYSVNNGASWIVIENVANNSGSYTWSVPENFSSECLVRVSQYNNPAVFDISDNVFTIAPSIILSTPNGDSGAEVWRVCTETSITWSSNGDSNYFLIEYSINNGLSWTTIESDYYNTATNVSYNWTLPNTPSTQCLVRVTDKNNTVKTDISDATFTISPAISVVDPNGGESLTGGAPYTISWLSDGVSNYYNIDYTINGGSSWTNICFNQNITTNEYSWNVPSSVSTNCLIKITDNVNTCKTDMSDQVFAIGTAASDVTITYPNGGESWDACTIETISWTSTGTSDNYNLYYSLDGGANWLLIEENYYTLTKTYDWTIPNMSSENCKIKIADAANTSFYDVSDAVYTISTVVADAGEDVAFCDGSSVSLNATGGVSYTWLPTTGLSNPDIANPVATPSSTTTYTVYVTDANGCTQPDDIVVTVNPIPPAPVASSNSPVDLNGDIELTASTVNMAFYSWSGPNGFTSTQQNPVITNATGGMSGTYSVYAIVAGCQSDVATTDVTVTGVPATVEMSGSVYTSTGIPVSGVSIALSGDETDSFTTAASGLYDFTVNTGGSYVITPSKNNDIVTNNGITTLDIILMQRHILSVQSLGSPYSILAADVNRSEGITTMDIVLTRALILQTSTSFPGGDLWSFVNSDFEFADPAHPWPFESTRSYSSASAAEDQDFIGIKLGDVNNSWNTNIAKSSEGELNLILGENSAVSNHIVSLPVTSDNFTDLSGLQLTLSWDDTYFEYAGVSSEIEDFYFGENFTENGDLTVVWSTGDLDGMSFDENQVLFTLQLLPVTDYSVTTQLEITGELTPAEAYDKDLDVYDVVLSNPDINIQFVPTDITQSLIDFNLNCHPNPFSEYVYINFVLKNNSAATLGIYNTLGEVVYNVDSGLSSGKNSLVWDGCDINGNKLPSGTYYVKLFAEDGCETIKLVIF